MTNSKWNWKNNNLSWNFLYKKSNDKYNETYFMSQKIIISQDTK